MEQILDRCRRLLVAMQAEKEKLRVAQDEKARAEAISKIDVAACVLEIWPSISAFEEDVAKLEAAGLNVACTEERKS